MCMPVSKIPIIGFPLDLLVKLLAVIALVIFVPIYGAVRYWRHVRKKRRDKQYRRKLTESKPPGPSQEEQQGQQEEQAQQEQQEMQQIQPDVTAVPEPAVSPPERNEYTDPSTDPPPSYASRKDTDLEEGASPSSPSPAHLR